MQVQTEPKVDIQVKPKDWVSPAIYVEQVKKKLESGKYKTIETKCFCGAEDDTVMVERDRYGIPHRMVTCNQCGLMRANPRMTAESYWEFYNSEYRKIYDGMKFNPHTCEYEINNKEYTKETEFLVSLGKGNTFYDFIEFFDVPVKSVIEIGCNTGAWLLPFKERGCEYIGVDWDGEAVKFGRSHGMNIIHGGIDDLITQGKKADLVILNHVVEHFTDLEGDLNKIRQLINPGGLLYIGTLGFYPCNKKSIFQNAHTYQFTADTLTYVMNCCGYDEYYTDEHIKSLWTPLDRKMSKKFKPLEGMEYLKRYLSGARGLMPRVRSVNKFPMKDRKENLDKALSYKYPPAIQIFDNKKFKNIIGIIIGGAPSVDNYIDEIKEKQSKGAKIVCIERMYPWCHLHGIIPDYVVVLDASTDVTLGFTHIQDKTTHLLSGQSHASVFEKVKGHKKNYIFCIPQKGIEQQNLWYKHGYKQMCLVNGGGSVTLCAWAIAMCLGLREHHIYGFDCHYSGGRYAKGIAGTGAEPIMFKVEIDGKMFETSSTFVSFMQQFFNMLEMAKKDGLVRDVKIFGDSLVAWASKKNISGTGFYRETKEIKEEKCEK